MPLNSIFNPKSHYCTNLFVDQSIWFREKQACIGAVCLWICVCTEVLPQKSEKSGILMWPCNVFVRNVHAQYRSAFRHTTVILEIERNGIISLGWEKSTLFPQVENWCMIEMKQGVAPVTFLSTATKTVLIFRLVLSLKAGWAFYRFWRIVSVFLKSRLGYPSFYGSICISVQLYNYLTRSFRIHVFFLPKIALSEREQFICDL